MRPALALLRRELTLAVRQGSTLGTALGFYLMIVTLMPLGLGPDLAKVYDFANAEVVQNIAARHRSDLGPGS